MRLRNTAFAPLLALVLCSGALGGVARARGAGDIALPEPRRDGEVSVERALAKRRSIRRFAPGPLPLPAVSQLLWAAQGITGPGGLRTAPSAGALYPLEVYLAAGAVEGVAAGLYRYEPGLHRLVLASRGDRRSAITEATFGQDWVADAPAILLVAAVERRTARKYGKRAARYVHMEVGHAAQNVYLQAAALGLATTMVGAFGDEELSRVLGLPDRERPLALLPVGRPR